MLLILQEKAHTTLRLATRPMFLQMAAGTMRIIRPSLVPGLLRLLVRVQLQLPKPEILLHQTPPVAELVLAAIQMEVQALALTVR